MTLFHATHMPYSLGEEIVASVDGSYYPEVLSIMESLRPAHSPSRSRCVFAADSIVAATTFLNSQQRDCATVIHVFEVTMTIHHKAPFRLIHEIGKRVKAGQSFKPLVAEYWLPKHDWVFWEFFGPSFQVVREVPAATTIEMAVFQLKYDKDITLSNSL